MDGWNTPGKTSASTCPACGGGLLFDPTLGKLKCEFCDSVYTPEEVEALWAQKAGEESQGLAEPDGGSPDGGETVREYEPVDFGADEEMRSYSCSTCGAELLADKTTAVMRCPYCGNQTIVEEQFSGAIRPDYIIPFAQTKDQAEEKYYEFYRKRFLLPKSFKNDNHVEEIQGVYVPFWMFSGRVHLEGSYIAYDEDEDDDGHKYITGRYEVHRRGYLDFENVPADASERMDDDLMDSVEPYKLDGLKDFSMVYLPGFMAERYDVSEEESRERGHDRAEGSIKSEVRKTIKHDGIDQADEKFWYENESTKYALMPVWLLVTKWKDKTFKFAMNGQTGRMVGDLPVSAGKMIGVLVPLFILMLAVFNMISGGEKVLESLFIAGIVDLLVGVFMYSSMKSVHSATSAGGYISQSLELVFQDEKKIGSFKARKMKKAMKKNKE
ncbi:MAG: hypothetical protein IJ073_03355 [Lachnospiraceae bacterium]|nr:hypothetical protein [Lachnospiraceae bacterium]